jgi:acetyl esterase/lipase
MITNPSLIIPLWPGGAPGSESWDQIEAQTTFPDGLHLVHNVTQPSLEVYPAESPNDTAVIVAPGGARHFLSIDHEGRQVAEWLTARGVTTFVLKYRLLRTSSDVLKETDEFIANPASKAEQMLELRALNLGDGQQAIRIVRSRAAEWGVDPDHIGFMGFSAGGGVTT